MLIGSTWEEVIRPSSSAAHPVPVWPAVVEAHFVRFDFGALVEVDGASQSKSKLTPSNALFIVLNQGLSYLVYEFL
jgi:hypothetical protein